MENIAKFLKAIEVYGVDKQDLFQVHTRCPWLKTVVQLSFLQTVDLYEGQNMAQVLTTLRKLSTVALTKGFGGPHIGVKMAQKNKRDHDEQKLREGRNVIGLQVTFILINYWLNSNKFDDVISTDRWEPIRWLLRKVWLRMVLVDNWHHRWNESNSRTLTCSTILISSFMIKDQINLWN